MLEGDCFGCRSIIYERVLKEHILFTPELNKLIKAQRRKTKKAWYFKNQQQPQQQSPQSQQQQEQEPSSPIQDQPIQDLYHVLMKAQLSIVHLSHSQIHSKSYLDC
jgi:hypothetical protein